MATYYIYSGMVSSGLTLSNDTGMIIYSGGKAENTTVNKGGGIIIFDSGTANNTTINYSAFMMISSGGTANYTTVNSYGYMLLSSGGTANYTTVNGGIIISTDGTANSTTLNSGGFMGISSGGTANGAIVNKGRIEILSGGTATNVVWTPCEGEIIANTGAYVTYTSNYYGVYFGSNNQLLSHTLSMSKKYVYGSDEPCSMYVMNSGVANSTTLDGCGTMFVSSGGIANNTTNAGWMYIYDGGIANNTTNTLDGGMFIGSGGTANNTSALSGVLMTIGSGGTATNIIAQSGARLYLTVASDTYIQGTYAGSAFEMKNAFLSGYTINSGGRLEIESGGTAIFTTVNAFDATEGMFVYDGGTATSTMVNPDGWLCIYSGGTANHTKVNGGYMSIAGVANQTTVNTSANIYIWSGGDMSNTTINSGGGMYLSAGGIHRGSLQIAGGAVVSAYSGSVIDFTVADRKTSDGYLINDLSLINGAPDYTITVNKNQKAGTYKLAQGAINFSGSITIGNGTVDYGTITVNGADFVHNGVTYSLDNVSGNLTLTVSGNTHPDGDLDGNGYADTILVNTKQGYSGAWMTTGTKSVILWGNLGNVNDKVELVGMGNVKGTSTNGSDIIMKIGTTVAAWVTDGGKVKSYKELYTLKSNMNMLGIGDFDGDGVTDYLLRSTAGDLGYVTGDDNKWHYIKGLGKEWKISAVGDLDGDGCDDVIVRHDAGFTGAYMIDKNGKITWSSLDTLKSDMSIVGTGDFNGDGVDDVLLQNKSNGWVGAWLVEDGRVDSFIGLCNNKNTIEQIADYNADGIDDLRIRTEKGDIGVLYVNGADNTTWKYFQSVGKEWDTSFALLS